jgi:hypothetical protein
MIDHLFARVSFGEKMRVPDGCQSIKPAAIGHAAVSRHKTEQLDGSII